MTKITFKSAWANCEKNFPPPRRARKLKHLVYEEFKANVLDENMALLTYEHVGIAGAFEKILELFPEE